MNKSASSSSTSEGDRQNNNNNDAKYRGVRKRKWGKWVSEIRLPNSRERIWLGSYDSPEKAARAFDAALFCLRGNTANFNFPHQPPNIPGGTDLHPSQIQAVAAHFANSYYDDPSSSTTTHHHHHHHHRQLQDDHQSQVLVSHDDDQYYQSMDIVSSHASSFQLMDDNDSTTINSNIPDFGIFPGFDDYFMPIQPPALTAHDYGEEAYNYSDGVYSQDPSFLWNF